MNITIGYLYYDLMNLYGEIGNTKVLEYHLKKQGIKTSIKTLSINDKINFNKLDVIIIGSGTEKARDLVLNDLMKYKNEIKKQIAKEKFFLITGNAYPLFGNSIINSDGKKQEALNIFNYNEIKTDRIVSDNFLKTKLINKEMQGFYNHYNEIIGDVNIFEKEGFHYNNFYGTYLLGPILARNPRFLIKFCKNLITSHQENFKFKKFNTSLEEKAYNNFITFKKTKKKIK